jgi:hypothetical protein
LPVIVFIGGGVPGLPVTLLGPTARTDDEGTGSAPFFDEDDIEAAAALKGVIAVIGLAGRVMSIFGWCAGGES